MTQLTSDRIERAARTLAYFENSDAFTSPVDHAGHQVLREEYRTRAAALLARAGTATNRKVEQPSDRTDAVLGLSFNRKASVAQLAALTPDEITALFGALHTIASITQPAAEVKP